MGFGVGLVGGGLGGGAGAATGRGKAVFCCYSGLLGVFLFVGWFVGLLAGWLGGGLGDGVWDMQRTLSGYASSSREDWSRKACEVGR